MIKENNSKKYIIGIIVALIVFVSGISYAYFEANVINAGVRTTSIATKNLSDLQIIDGTTSSSNNMIPGDSVTQTFQVRNNNDMNLCFALNWSNVSNTFVNTSDLHVSLSDGTNNIPLTLDTFPTTGEELATNMKINASTTNNYTLTVTYVNTEADQTGDMGKSFSGRITGEIVECTGPEETLQRLAKLNSNYTYTSNSNKCLTTDSTGMITNYNSPASTSIICSMEDDYGTSYYLRGNHQDNNVKFANMCWKIIRVTGTGGIKMIYNGDLDANGKCTTTSGEHNGLSGTILYSQTGNKPYGSSYTKNGSTYTLTNISTLNYPSEYEQILGKYTCGSTSSTCSSLYAVIGEYDSKVYAVNLDQSTNYAQIGTSSFNSPQSPAHVGYMYNDDNYSVEYKSLSNDTNNYYYGSSFTYNANNARPYTLTNTVRVLDITNSASRNSLNTHHYTCFNAANNTCDKLYFIFYLGETSPSYITLIGNETINNALDKMIRNDNINVKDSDIKGVVDYWYKTNLEETTFESYLEDTVFCNDRTISDLGGWKENGNLSSEYLLLNTGGDRYYLKCPNKRDAFTVDDTTNGNGALKYPVGLMTMTEAYLIGNSYALKTGAFYYTLSPTYITHYYGAFGGDISDYGNYYDNNMNYGRGVRPSISLKPGTKFVAGTDGTASNPFEVQ